MLDNNSCFLCMNTFDQRSLVPVMNIISNDLNAIICFLSIIMLSCMQRLKQNENRDDWFDKLAQNYHKGLNEKNVM